jgi:hypothetical protein
MIESCRFGADQSIVGYNHQSLKRHNPGYFRGYF